MYAALACLICITCVCPSRTTQLRDEKRVFYKYWAAKFVRLFMAAKRFRLLAPFKGSTVCDPGKPPIFSLEETRRLWAYVRGVRGWALEQYPMCRLESQEFLDIDYERVLRDVLWHFPRNVWQVRYLWTKEYTAWLKTERQRMNWTSWQWNMDWEVCCTIPCFNRLRLYSLAFVSCRSGEVYVWI